jgi:hypothetical protein
MEIPPPSSFAQSSAYFTGFSEVEQRGAVLGIQPEPFPNKFTESLDITQAASVTSIEREFKNEEYSEAYRLLNGQLMYPYQSIAEITNHKFDPSYFDGSEEYENFNVQENLIGTPLGATELTDPRVSYIDALLKLKENGAVNDPMHDSYIKYLYLNSTEKGVNYYFNQLQDLNEALGSYSRQSEEKNRKYIHDSFFNRNNPRGVVEHRRQIDSSEMPNMSTTPSVQYNYRREEMTKNEKYIKNGNEAKPDIKQVDLRYSSADTRRPLKLLSTPRQKSYLNTITDEVLDYTKKQAIGYTVSQTVNALGDSIGGTSGDVLKLLSPAVGSLASNVGSKKRTIEYV